MISEADLRRIARSRLKDAQALLSKKRYAGATYLCGYAVELALKARICKTLKWTDFPETRKEFDGYASFKTHDLDVLLRLSGREAKLKSKAMAEWSLVGTWDPEVRYSTATPSKKDTQSLIKAAETLLRLL